MSEDARRYWDGVAPTFDDDPDHGLRDPGVRRAWSASILPSLPPPPASVVDLGCGTGGLAVLLAAGVAGRFSAADAASPPVGPGSVDER